MENEMGDRFYDQQKNYKPKRRLKKDIIANFESLLGQEVKGLDRLTIETLDNLHEAVQIKLYQEAVLEAALDAEIVEVEDD